MQFSTRFLFFALLAVMAASSVEGAPMRRDGKCKPRPSSAAHPVASQKASAKPPTAAYPPKVSAPAYSVPHMSPSPVPSPSSVYHSSRSSSSPPPAKPSNKPSPPPSNSIDASLFPVPSTLKSWSTCPSLPNSLPLSDATFNPQSNMNSLQHPTVKAPDGQQSIRATYPKGSAALSGKDAPIGGFSFYAPGPTDKVDLTKAKEVTLGYSVLFPEGFEFNLGGKLPGLYGGDDAQGAMSCSGGRRDKTCWSARFMWRDSGKGELYTYLPPTDEFPANKAQCNVPPLSDCNDVYGASVGRGAWKFVAGQRSYISQRVLLNDPGQSNGEIQVWHNGESVINLKGLVLRDSGKGVFRGIQMQTFFGGHDSNPWGSPKDQESYFSDFTVGVTKML